MSLFEWIDNYIKQKHPNSTGNISFESQSNTVNWPLDSSLCTSIDAMACDCHSNELQLIERCVQAAACSSALELNVDINEQFESIMNGQFFVFLSPKVWRTFLTIWSGHLGNRNDVATGSMVQMCVEPNWMREEGFEVWIDQNVWRRKPFSRLSHMALLSIEIETA